MMQLIGCREQAGGDGFALWVNEYSRTKHMSKAGCSAIQQGSRPPQKLCVWGGWSTDERCLGQAEFSVSGRTILGEAVPSWQHGGLKISKVPTSIQQACGIDFPLEEGQHIFAWPDLFSF